MRRGGGGRNDRGGSSKLKVYILELTKGLYRRGRFYPQLGRAGGCKGEVRELWGVFLFRRGEGSVAGRGFSRCEGRIGCRDMEEGEAIQM